MIAQEFYDQKCFFFDCYGNGWDKLYFSDGQLNRYTTYHSGSCFTKEVYISNGNQIVRNGKGKEISYSHDSLNIYITSYVNGIAQEVFEFDSLLRLITITKYNENKTWSRLEIDNIKGFCINKKYILEDGLYYEKKRFSFLIGIRKQTITIFLKRTLNSQEKEK